MVRMRPSGLHPVRAALLWAVVAGLCLFRASTFGQIVLSAEPPFAHRGTGHSDGTGFLGGALTVRFGGPNAARDTTATATSDTIIWARVPNGATTGPIYVQVGSRSALSLEDFLVLGLGPYLTGFFPTYGSVGEDVIITGWHLTNLASVKFGSQPSSSIMANANGTQITARVPSGATNGPHYGGDQVRHQQHRGLVHRHRRWTLPG
jgi:hypothetical protein